MTTAPHTTPVTPGLKEHVQVALRSFLLFMQAKRRECFKDFTQGQRDAFIMIPHMLHTSEPKQFSYVNGVLAPCGIHGYKYSEEIKEIGRRLFQGRDRFAEPNQATDAPIESLSIMGSAGSIAQTEGSDLDYWVAIRAGLPHKERARLQAKLTAIENWCMETLKAEVHFFISASTALRDNDFGGVSKESCGSALAKLLKEEYYRSSLHVMGKIPLWWLSPCGADAKAYASIPGHIVGIQGFERDDFVDFGNIGEIPSEEFVGGGMWQLNKGVGSPFKSALKMGNLLAYAKGTGKNELLAQTLKRRMLDHPSDIDRLDPYRMMVEQVIGYHLERGEKEQALLLQRCLFLKMHVKVSRWWESKLVPPDRAVRVMLEFMRAWGWSLNDIEKWEQFEYFPMSEVVRFKHELEDYMFNSLQSLRSAEVPAKSRKVNIRDFRKMTQRIATVFNTNPRRTEWFYPPFHRMIVEDIYSIQEEEQGGAWVWNLYTGIIDAEGVLSAGSAKKLLRTAPSLAELSTWMLFNQLIRPNTRIMVKHRRDIPFSGNLRRLGTAFQEHIGKPELPTLDDDTFVLEPRPIKWLVVVNLVPFLAIKEADAEELEEAEDKEEVEEKADDPLVENGTKIHDTGLIANELVEALDEAGYKTKVEEIKAKSEESGVSEETMNLGGKVLPLRAGRVPHREDPFNAGVDGCSVYQDIFVIELNSWGEVYARSMPAGRPDAYAIADIVSEGLRQEKRDIAMRCEVGFGPYHTATVQKRFAEVMETMVNGLLKSPRPSAVGIYQTDGDYVVIVRQKKKAELTTHKTFPEAVHHANLAVEVETEFVFDGKHPRLAIHRNICQQARRGENLIHLMEIDLGIMISCVDQRGRYLFDAVDKGDFIEQWPPFLLSFLTAWRWWASQERQGSIRILRQKAGENEGREITQEVLAMFTNIRSRLPRTQIVLDSAEAMAWMNSEREGGASASPVDAKLIEKISEHEAIDSRPFILSGIRLENSEASAGVWSPCLQLQLRQGLIRKGRRLQHDKKAVENR